jgi:hypothetical protein
VGRELVELWREHDSTGLRAEAKLIHTALAVRVAPKTRANFSVASETTQQTIKGKPLGFPFLMAMTLRRRSRAVMMVCCAMLARVAVVRG